MLYPQQNNARNTYDLSGIWDFRIDPDHVGERAGWATNLTASRPIAVPASWNDQYQDLLNYLDLAWYVTRAYVPHAWHGQRVFLRVGAASYRATVYVNGTDVGSHDGGHLPFAFEITHLVAWDRPNIIAISVENNLHPTRVPAGNMSSALGVFASYPRTTFDFFPFAGIHRPVILYSVPQLFVDDITVVTALNGSESRVKVTLRLNQPQSITGTVCMSGHSGEVRTDIAFDEGIAVAHLTITAAHLWSDKDPYLYDLTVQTASDQYTLPIGLRTVAVQEGRILLNGQPVHLNGFGRHEDFFASGKGLNLPVLVKDFHLMQWIGANSYRTAHYPYSDEDMQMADRLGFLVIDEIPAVSLQFETDENANTRLRVCQQQLDELIARDKNHPSVLMWCVANEPLPTSLNLAAAGTPSSADPSVARGKVFLDTLLSQARALDPTRLVTLVTVMGGPQEWMENCDVVCMNRYWGWYVLGGEIDKALVALEQELDGVWDRWHKPIIMTEFGADTLPGLHALPPVMWAEEYQADIVRGYLEVAARKHYIAGMHVWNFADFAAVQSVGRVGGQNMKGVFTRARAPKMAAHVLREFWLRSANTANSVQQAGGSSHVG